MRTLRLRKFGLGLALAFSLAGCARNAAVAPAATPLPAVSPVVARAELRPLPAWIAALSPHGEAADGAQIRIRFKKDVVGLEALEAPQTQDALQHIAIEPDLAGRFVLLTPRMIGFQADAPIPHAARIRITLRAGLADLAGDRLDADYAWSFTTQPLVLSGLPGTGDNGLAIDDGSLEPSNLRPTFGVDASVAVDTNSLVAHASLVDRKDPQHPIAVEAVPSSTPSASASGPPEAPGTEEVEPGAHYDLRPVEQLRGDRIYDLAIARGVAPQRGNVPTSIAYAGKLRTYGPLTFAGVTPYGEDDASARRYVGGAPLLTFSNPLEEKSAKAAVRLSPSPLPSIPALAVDGQTIRVNPYALRPDTRYAIAIAPSLTDRFGQTLGTRGDATFTTGDLAGDLWAPSGLNLFPSILDLRVNVETTNLPDGRYRFAAATIAPEDLITTDVSNVDVKTYLGVPAGWQTKNAPRSRNVAVDSPIPLRSLLHGTTGMLAYGVSARTFQVPDAKGKLVWNEPEFDGIVQLTDIGLFAQWFPGAGFVRAEHLSDGTPIAHVLVDVYESQTEGPARSNPDRRPCAQGETDATGTFTVDSAGVARCASTASSAERAPELLFIAHDGKDWSYVRTANYQYNEDFYAGWSAGEPIPHGTIVCDRELYQPGETAQFTGIAYFDIDGTLARGRSPRYDVVLGDPDGKQRSLGTRSLDAYGAFTIALPIGKGAATGYYSIAAKGQAGETLEGSFRVAEFKPPNFKVALTLDAQTASAGATVTARTQSSYLFGAPVEGGRSHVYVTREQTNFTPQGWSSYTFGPSWSYPDEAPSVAPDVMQSDSVIGAEGSSSVRVGVPDDLPFPMTFNVESETTDVSNLSVSDRSSFAALPSDALIGLQADFVAEERKPFEVQIVLVDPKGRPRTDRRVKLVLQRREFLQVTEELEGAETPREAIHYVDVSSQELAPAQTPQRVRLTAPQPGSYRVEANLTDAKSRATATDLDVFVSGTGEADWGEADPTRLSVKLDKPIYRAGETATALVQSPYADGELYFSVVRHGVLYQTARAVHGGAPQLRFTVTPDMLPNAVVEAVLVRRGTSLAQSVPSTLGKLARVGFAPFEVALDAKYITVGVKARRATLAPGGAQQLELHLAGHDGEPVRGEMTVAVVNDAILQLSGYRFPDLVKLVYADQPISMRWADNRDLVTLVSEQRSVDKGFGFGGGAMAGPAGTRVRTAFKPLAFWSGTIRSDASGNAAVDFVLPDDLTTWRAMVLAYSADARFGTGETTFVATKPLVTNPVLPQFARPGDRFSGGVAITDVARASGTYKVMGTLAGGLAFADAGPPGSRIAVESPADVFAKALRFSMNVSGPQDARVSFTTALGDLSDTFEVGLPISTGDVTESVVTTGATAARAVVPLAVDARPAGSAGGLDVTLASTLLADTLEPERDVLQEQPPFATALAARIAIASDALEVDRLYGRAAPPELRRQVGLDLDALRALALPDGGYAEWPGAKAGATFSTAFVAVQLAQAKAAGFGVDGELAHARRFLESRLADPSPECEKGDARCDASTRLEALETFGILGQPRSDFLDDIYRLHAELGYYEQVELARHLIKLPSWRTQGIALRDKLMEQLYETGRRATIEVPGEFGETPAAGQGQVLGLLIESNAPPEQVDKVMTSLLALRHAGLWGCVCDDAEAMNAIVLYARRQRTPPDFTARATLPGTTLRAAFHGFEKTSSSASIPYDRLPAGRSDVVLSKDGEGILHYSVALRYQVAGTSPGTYAGIRIDRAVRAPAGNETLLAFGLAKPDSDATLVAGRVYAIDDIITTDHPLDDVVVDDPLPAGLEAVDQTFNTAVQYYQAGWDNWQVDYQSIHRDHVLAFAHHLQAGVYAVHYLVRSVTPGSYGWPGARAYLEYAPEEFGRTASSRLMISEK